MQLWPKIFKQHPNVVSLDNLVLNVLAGVGTLQSLALSELVNSWSLMMQLLLVKGHFRLHAIPLESLFPIKFSSIGIALEKYSLKEMKVGLQWVFKKENWCGYVQGYGGLYSLESYSGPRSKRNIARKSKKEHCLDWKRKKEGQET